MTDIIIIGAGPAGLTASIYALRANKTVLMLEGLVVGGQAGSTYEIKNYPGFENISGPDLVMKMFEQAEKLGLKLEYAKANKIEKIENGFAVFAGEKKYEAKKVILCLGAKPKKLDVQINTKLIGKGLSYCATCDGNFFKNKVVAVIGAGNSAFENAKYLCGLAKKVYLVHQTEVFKASETLIDDAKNYEKDGRLEYLLNKKVEKIVGNEIVEGLKLKDLQTGEQNIVNVDGVFVAIGTSPDTDWLGELVALDEKGYIIVNKNMETNINGIYAAGDATNKEIRQIVTACGDGAIAGVKASQ